MITPILTAQFLPAILPIFFTEEPSILVLRVIAFFQQCAQCGRGGWVDYSSVNLIKPSTFNSMSHVSFTWYFTSLWNSLEKITTLVTCSTAHYVYILGCGFLCSDYTNSPIFYFPRKDKNLLNFLFCWWCFSFCLCLYDRHFVHFKYFTILFVHYISIKLEKIKLVFLK